MAACLNVIITFGFLFVFLTCDGSESDGSCFQGECSETQDKPKLIPPESIYAFQPDKIGFDEIYLINLKRRPERKERLVKMFNKMKLNVTIWEATDGRLLSQKDLDDAGYNILPGFIDPFEQRPMTFGEVGCLLSHYNIWKDIQDKGHKKALILEDDATFKPEFRHKWSRMYAELNEFVGNWDLLYFGRKPLESDRERLVDGSRYLVWPHYSYWTVAYAITDKGVGKLIDQRPIQKMIPVDEFLPIMFDRNPNGEELWNKFFFPKNLVAVSLEPLLVKPAWFPGKSGYETDTENSKIVNT